MTPGLRVLIVDDHALLVDSLAFVLAEQGVTLTHTDLVSTDSVLRQAADTRPHLVLLDLDLGGRLGSGEDLIVPLSEDGHRVLVMTGSRDPARLGHCLALGATGVLSKGMPLSELVGQVIRAAGDDPVNSAEQRQELLAAHRAEESRDQHRRALLDRLSAREQAVLEALVDGQSVGRIAATFVVSEATVRTQVRSILAKLGVNSQLEAVAIAGRHGWFR